jgi:2'-5' RNA ligase
MNSEQVTPSGQRRAFIGIPVDKAFQVQINRVLESVRASRRDISWVPEGNRHLTLAFLGKLPDRQIEALLDSFDQTYRQEQHFEYGFTKLTHFPARSSRLIALTGEPAGALAQLFDRTQAFLEGENARFDRKPFRPHITLGRIKKVQKTNDPFELPVDIRMSVNTLKFFQSTLTRSGSIYSTLREVQLRHGRGDKALPA